MRIRSLTLPRTRDGVAAVVIATIALAASLGSYLYINRSSRLVRQVEVQTMLFEAYQGRAFSCMDVARAAMTDPNQRERAEKSLNISNGITLCVVKSRDEALLEVADAVACIRKVETANAMLDAGGAAAARPAC